MARIARRTVKGRIYYYLEESVKKGSKWVKESVYLGNAVPNEPKLEKIYLKFREDLAKKGIFGVAPPYTEFVTRKMAIKLETAARHKLAFVASLSGSKRAEFIRRERITFVTDSNAIEGSTLDYSMTEQALAPHGKIKPGYIFTGTGREEQEAINLDRCLNEYEKCISAKAEISERMILHLHYILLSKIEGYSHYRGIWRPINVMIRGSNHDFPHHGDVPLLMGELLLWYHKNKNLIHPAELAAKFHTKFTTIHPFADGNGRMARLLMNYILQKNGFPFTNIPLRRRSTYMKTQAAGNKADHKPFALFLAQEIIKQNRKLK